MKYIAENEKISIRRQCELMELNRSTFNYKPKGESEENLAIMRIMDEHYLECPTEGVLRVQDYLLTLSLVVNEKRVRRLLRLMGIMAIYPKRNLSKLRLAKHIRPYLLKGMKINRPNIAWAIDITYIPMAKGFLYLTAIIDIYSRYIVAWDLHNSLEARNTLAVLEQAITEHGKPEIINSDQGSQFTCPLWTEYCDQAGIKISMDGKGRAIDNIFIERFWHTIKWDYVYLHPYHNGTQMYAGIKEFIYRYNRKAHQGIGRIAPIKLFQQAA